MKRIAESSNTFKITKQSTLTAGSETSYNYISFLHKSAANIISFSTELCTLFVDHSYDGVNIYKSYQLSDSSIDMDDHYVTPIAEYMKFRIRNDSLNEATVISHIIIYSDPQNQISINKDFSKYSEVINTKSALIGIDDSGIYKNIKVTYDGNLKGETNVDNFGSLVVTEPQPIFGGSFIYNSMNTKKFTLLGNGTQTFNDALMSLNIASLYSYMVLRSNEIIQYEPGSINTLKFSCVFNEGVAGSQQRIGYGNANNDLGFGYNGLDFGIVRSYGGKIHSVDVTITSAATSSGNITVTLNSIPHIVAVTNAAGDLGFTAYQISKGTYSNWIARHIGTTVNFTYASGVGLRSGTYSVTPALGVTTTAFTTLTNGQSLTETWVLEADFDNPIVVNKQLGNIYAIDFSWLGYNNIAFKIFSPLYNEFITVHTIRYPNTSVNPSVYMPHMYFQMAINSLGSTTAMSLSSASIGAFTSHKKTRVTSPNFTFSNSKLGISANTETIIYALKVKYQLNGIIVNSKEFIDDITFACEGIKATRMSIYINPTTLSTGTTATYPNWVDVSADSMMATCTNPITFTGGTLLYQYYLSKTGNLVKDYIQEDFKLVRDDILLITAFSTGASDISSTISWITSL